MANDFKQLNDFLNNFASIAQEAADAAKSASAIPLQKEMKLIMNTSGGPPAPAGGAPAIRTGNLRRSIQSQIVGNTVLVGSVADYSRFLEYGTSKMAARPFLQRSLNLAQSQMEYAAKNAVQKIIDKYL
jgi:HK97 gp10 family phage protein